MRGFDSKRTCNITFLGASYGKGRNAVNTKATHLRGIQFSLQVTTHNLLLRMDQSDRVPIILATIVDSDSVETSSSSLSEGAHQTRGACSSAFVWNATVHSHPVITASCGSTASTDAMERKDTGTSGIGSSQSPYAQSPDSALMAGSSIYGRQVVFFPPPSLACAGAFDPLGNILPNYTQPVLSPFPNVPSWIPSSYPGVTTHPQTLLWSGEASSSEQILGHGNNATLGRPIPAFPARIIAMAPNPYCPSGFFPKPTLFGPPQVRPNGTSMGVSQSMRMLPSSRSTSQKITSSLKAQTHTIDIKKPSPCFTHLALATGVRSKRKVGFALPEVLPHKVSHRAKATRAAPTKKARFSVAETPKSPGR